MKLKFTTGHFLQSTCFFQFCHARMPFCAVTVTTFSARLSHIGAILVLAHEMLQAMFADMNVIALAEEQIASGAIPRLQKAMLQQLL